MELLAALLVAALILFIAMPFVALAKAARADRVTDELRSRVSALENEVRLLQRQAGPAADASRHAEKEAPGQEKSFRPPLPRQSVPSSPVPEMIPPAPAVRAPAPAAFAPQPAGAFSERFASLLAK